MGGQGFFERHSNILLYVPNLIGYARVLAALYAFSVATTQPLQCFFAYGFSFFCDELDGRFARMLGQTSTLGAVLDMVTDRLATTGLLIILAIAYPNRCMLMIALIFLDVFSHWFQMYASLAMGATTHKDVKSRSWLVRKYYSSRMFMGYCCISCEVMYLALYAASHPSLMALVVPAPKGVVLPALPPWLLRAVPELSPLFPGPRVHGLPFATVMALLSVPGVVTKQICNWFQLRTAAVQLVQYDLEREAKAKTN